MKLICRAIGTSEGVDGMDFMLITVDKTTASNVLAHSDLLSGLQKALESGILAEVVEDASYWGNKRSIYPTCFSPWDERDLYTLTEDNSTGGIWVPVSDDFLPTEEACGRTSGERIHYEARNKEIMLSARSYYLDHCQPRTPDLRPMLEALLNDTLPKP